MSLPERSVYHSVNAVWVLARNGEVPAYAVPGGKDSNGEVLYVSRFIAGGRQLAPGKLSPTKGVACSGYSWIEQTSNVYQVLTHPNQQQLKWVLTSRNNVPTGALQAGGTDDDPLFVARAPFQGGICCGKFHPSQNCAYLTGNGREHQVLDNFEVLCVTKIS